MEFDIQEYISNFSRYPSPAALKLWTKEHGDIAVHTRALKPDALISKRRPYEDDGIKDYRLANYEPITADVFGRAIDQLQDVLSSSQVTINCDEDLKEYIARPAFGSGLDFMTFLNKKVIRRMIEDPNGVLLWWPVGRGTTVSNEQVDVAPKLILSTQIKHFDDNVFTYLSPEKSLIKVQKEGKDQDAYEGKIYYIVTRDTYYKYEQVGKKSDDKYELKVHYKHDFKEVPVIVLGGEEADDLKKTGETIQYLKSYFHTAVPYANEAVRQFSDHQAVMVTSAFPIREMKEIPCTAKGCDNGVLTEIIEDEVNGKRPITKTCETCKGKGYIVPFSPFGVLTTKRGDSMNEKEVDVPAIRFISPDVSILEYGGKHWRDLLKDAEKALHLLFIGQAQSGKAKEIDREPKIAMLDKVGTNVYNNIVYNSLRVIDKLRNIGGGKGRKITINLPSTFKKKTEQEMIEEIGILRDKNAPSFLIAQASIDYIKKRYSGDTVIQHAVDFLALYDPIFFLTQDEKDRLLASSVIDETQHAKSLYSFSAITAVAREMGEEFLTAQFEEIRTKTDALIAPLVSSGTPPPPPAGS